MAGTTADGAAGATVSFCCGGFWVVVQAVASRSVAARRFMPAILVGRFRRITCSSQRRGLG